MSNLYFFKMSFRNHSLSSEEYVIGTFQIQRYRHCSKEEWKEVIKKSTRVEKIGNTDPEK